MACCASLPYFVTSDRDVYSVTSDSDDLLMYECDHSDGDDDVVLRKCLMRLGEPDPVTSCVCDEPLSVSLRPSSDTAAAASTGGPLLNDCMWSAGMLPPDLKAAAGRGSRDDCVSSRVAAAADDADVDTCTAVDPSLVSPCPHQPVTLPGARHVTSLPFCTSSGIWCLR